LLFVFFLSFKQNHKLTLPREPLYKQTNDGVCF
jgi:hypothetical protein